MSPYVGRLLATVLLSGRQYREAVEQLQRVTNGAPGYVSAYGTCATAYTAMAMHNDAVAQGEKAATLSDRSPYYVSLLGRAYAHAGQRSEAETILEELRTRDDREYVTPLALALVSMALGDAEFGLEWLEQVYRGRGHMLWFANVYPLFDDFRSEPRFQDLLRKMNFPPEP